MKVSPKAVKIVVQKGGRESEREKERSCVCWFSPQMPSAVGCVLGWGQELETLSLPCEWQEPKYLILHGCLPGFALEEI